MKYRVKVLADSLSPPVMGKPDGVRLTTVCWQAPRTILAEWNTHRVLSRSTSSSRAIPVSVALHAVETDPYVPDDLPGLPLCGNQAGMQATQPLSDSCKRAGQDVYRYASTEMLKCAKHLLDLGWHKQDANRLLEPFTWVRVISASTDWANFFALRTDWRAYPPFQFLAKAIYIAISRSTPQKLEWGEWHLPFITQDDRIAATVIAGTDRLEQKSVPPGFASHEDAYLAKWSMARCARVSYGHFGQKAGSPPDRAKDLDTYNKLVSELPRHAAPGEMPAFCRPNSEAVHGRSNYAHPWVQLRKLIPDETVKTFQPSPLEIESWKVPEEVFSGDDPGRDW